MNNKKNYSKGTRNLASQVILNRGFFPRDALNINNKSVQVGKQALRTMTKEGVLKDIRVVIERTVYKYVNIFHNMPSIQNDYLA